MRCFFLFDAQSYYNFFFYFLNVLKCAIFSNKKLSHLKKIGSMKFSANAEIIKALKWKGQWGSDPLKPIPFVLVPEIVNNKAVSDLYCDNLPSTGI